MINLLYVLPQLGAGGSERVVLDLARNLDRSSFNVNVAYFNPGLLVDSFKEAGVELFHIPKKQGFDAAAMWQIAGIVKNKKISIINAHHYMPFFYSFIGAKILNRKKLVFTEHSVPEVQAVNSSVHRNICSLLLRHADAVIGVSTEITRAFTSLYPVRSRRFNTIVNGIDLDRFANSIDRTRERAALGLSNNHIVVGVVANFRKVKNHACLLRATTNLKARFPQLKLLLVGSGHSGDPENSEEEIRRFVHEHNLQDKVIFTGYQRDIPRYLKLLDIFCLPSFSEGLPLSILEAMATKIPVVASNVNGVREVISDRENGLLFPSNDDRALAAVLEKLIACPELGCKLTRTAHAYVQNHHGLNAWINRYENLYLKLA